MTTIGTMHQLRLGVTQFRMVREVLLRSSTTTTSCCPFTRTMQLAASPSLSCGNGRSIMGSSSISRPFSNSFSSSKQTLSAPTASPAPLSMPCSWLSKKNHSTNHAGNDRRPKLAHEWIVDGRVLPSKQMEGFDGGISQGKEVIVFLHGLLGNAKVCII